MSSGRASLIAEALIATGRARAPIERVGQMLRLACCERERLLRLRVGAAVAWVVDSGVLLRIDPHVLDYWHDPEAREADAETL